MAHLTPPRTPPLLLPLHLPLPLLAEEVEDDAEDESDDGGEVPTTPNSGSRRTRGARTPDSYDSWGHGHGLAEFLMDEGLLG